MDTQKKGTWRSTTWLGAYWYHRASHAHPVLWRFHAIHHSAEHIDWLVNTRAHPVDLVFTRLAGLVPVYLLGLAQVTGGRLDGWTRAWR